MFFLTLAADMLTGVVAPGNYLLNYALQWQVFADRFGPIKLNCRVKKACDKSALPFLGQAKVQSVQKLPAGLIAQLFQDAHHLLQGLALIVRGQLPYIFQEKGLGAFGVNNLRQVEKQRPPGVVKSPHSSDDAERLAGKAGKEDVVPGYGLRSNGGDVAGRGDTEVGGVGAAGFLVNVASENAGHTQIGGSEVETTDAAEQIRESKGCFARAKHHIAICKSEPPAAG